MYSFEDLKNAVDDIDFSEEQLLDSDIILFGAGMRGTFVYEKLRKKYNIREFWDNNPDIQNKKKQGLAVVCPQKADDFTGIPFVIITLTGNIIKKIKKQLSEMEIPHITYAEYILKTEFEKFESVYKMLDDEFSKVTFVNLLMSHLNSEMCREICVKDQYFALPEFFTPSNKEVFADCGAYVGDSAEMFIQSHTGIFKRIYTFEPTEKIFNTMCVRIKRLISEWALNENQIIAEKAVIGEYNGLINFYDNAKENAVNRVVSDNSSDSKSKYVKSVSIDEYFRNKEDAPTFIKADIEGSEMALINGAEDTIKKHKPKLAVCVYHRFEDLIQIPLKLSELNPDYKMYIRHHTYSFEETVLYCC